jgi:hypothetical protein
LTAPAAGRTGSVVEFEIDGFGVLDEPSQTIPVRRDHTEPTSEIIEHAAILAVGDESPALRITFETALKRTGLGREHQFDDPLPEVTVGLVADGEEPDYGTVQPVIETEALEHLGVTKLTRSHVEALKPLAHRSWFGRCAVLNDAGGSPTEIYFWGFSGD